MTTALHAAQGWTVAEQVEFVQRLWDHIVDSGWQPQLTAEQRAELDRRLAAHEADPTNVLTWEEVLAHLRRPR
jgi:putative addiction module component (TIGR02574 family)